jgi:hypothetical protein
MWAGSPLVARAIICELTNQININKYSSLQSAIDDLDLTENQKKEVDIIVVHSKLGAIVSEEFGNVSHDLTNGLKRTVAGTGEWPFFYENQYAPIGDHSKIEHILDHLLNQVHGKIGKMIFDEGFDRRNLVFGFGGWIDLLHIAPFGAGPIPYSVKCWGWDGEKIASLWPVIFSMYIDERLCVCAASDVSKKFRVFQVPDITDLHNIEIESEKYRFNPVFQINMIIDQQTKDCVIMKSGGNSNALSVEFSDDGILPIISPHYIEFLNRNAADLLKRKSILPYEN